ncbi:MAG: helix-turn-helix domain-containing protein, partial [Candidatus Acidiferrales bacterium]
TWSPPEKAMSPLTMPTLTPQHCPPIFAVSGENENMTKGTFGENLKREREMRGVTLEEITTATRIATRFLKAIESEQWDQLPGGVFNRGFVRAVARYLGLDEENIVAEYALAVQEQPSVPVWTGKPPVVAPEPHWAGWILLSVVVISLIAGGWFATRRILAWRAARRAARTAQMSSADAPAPPELHSVNVAATPPGETAANSPSPPAAAAQPAPAPPDSTAPAAASPTTADAALLVLKVEAVKKTKVTVEADTDRMFEGTMKAGENHVFSAKDRFDVSARDAGALLLELNGKTMAPIGAPGKSGKVALTRDSLKGAAGGGN